MADVIDPEGNVYRFDGDLGAWRHIPGGATAEAMAIDWNALERIGGPPDPLGPDWPTVDSAASPQAAEQLAQQAATMDVDTGRDVIDPEGNVYRFDGDLGAWRHIPDVDTANAMGVDWNALERIDGAPQPLAGDWPTSQATAAVAASAPPPPAAPVTTAAASDTFTFYERRWGQGDLAAFIGALAAHGQNYSVWAASHEAAAALLEGPPSDPSREQVPKSVGEALGMAIAGGASAAEAAAQAAALAASQRAQGFGAPTPGQLLDAAKQVAAAYAGGGGTPAPAAPPPADDGDPSRSLQFVNPGDLLGQVYGPPSPKQAKGVNAGWRELVNFWKTTVPAKRDAVESVAESLRGVFG